MLDIIDVAAPAAAQPLAPASDRTIALHVPISDDAGRTWTEITLVEPLLRHRMTVLKSKTALETQRTIALLALLADVPESAVRRMKTRDAKRAADLVEIPSRLAVAIDVIADAAADPMPLENAFAIMRAVNGLSIPPEHKRVVEVALNTWTSATDTEREGAALRDFAPALEQSRTFELYVPVVTPTGTITSVTVREPDLDAGISVERIKDNEATATAAMIATLSGLTIPVVQRFSLRDVARIERWLGFFSMPGAI